MAAADRASDESFSEPDLFDDDMGPGFNGETLEKIQMIELDAGGDAPVASGDDAPVAEQTGPLRKRREILTSDVWNHFEKGPTQPDGSYDATCNYCGKVYPMGNQRSTSCMRHHISKSCRKIPSSKRRKSDAVQRMLQAGNATADGPNPVVWVFDQLRSRRIFCALVTVSVLFMLLSLAC